MICEHRWDLSPQEAIALQRELAPRVREELWVHNAPRVAATDVCIRGGRAYAAVVVVAIPECVIEDRSVWCMPVPYPYVPGLLAFREIPCILRALEVLSTPYDVLMADGHGLVHPRRFGLACHLGVLLDKPCVGVAKRPYVGIHKALNLQKGATEPLLEWRTGEVLGMAVRTRAEVTPVYVSVGHRMSLKDAVALTMRCTTRFRIPEPIRQAHLLSRRGLS